MVPEEAPDHLASTETIWQQRLAVISPHRAQNAAIRAALANDPAGAGAVVETADKIQGKERDAIVASYTVSDPEFALAEAEFIFSIERLNVTITRARTKLILIVSRRLLDVVILKSEEPWARFTVLFLSSSVHVLREAAKERRAATLGQEPALVSLNPPKTDDRRHCSQPPVGASSTRVETTA